MTFAEAIAITVACAGAALAVVTAVAARRQRIRSERRARAFPWKGGEVTITAPLSEAEYEEIKARWQALHGQPGRAHQVEELKPEESQ